MKSIRVLVIKALVVLAVVLTSSLSLALPGLINYQGNLTDDSGTPLNGTYEMRFALYSAETDGSMLWNHLPDSHVVTVSEGVFNVQLGSLHPLLAAIFEWDPVYLEISIYNIDSGSWEPFSPRQRLTSVPYALRSEKATEAVNASKADTLDGFDSDDFVATGGGTMTGVLTLPANGLTAGNGQFVLIDGKVGIGTDNPTYKLDVDEGSGNAIRGSSVVGIGVEDHQNGSGNYSLLGTSNSGVEGISSSGTGVSGSNTDNFNFNPINRSRGFYYLILLISA